ncbi:MAG: tRNA pseudouridine(55) synthase TruB [Acidimicrobiia bacterium]
MTTGFLVVDKPSGITSHDVVDEVRRATGIRKAGHTGTLDPLATGVVVVAVGGVTRLIRFLQDLDKEYVATARFGVATDTLDADGAVTDEVPMDVTIDDLESVRSQFVGEIQQIPPMVSALKKDGQRLYDLARQGLEVERESRTIHVHELEFLDVGDGEHPLVTFRVVCGKGTYVRSLADDLARALGGFAHLTTLRRTRNGALTAEAAVPVDQLDRWMEHLVTPSDALSHLPILEADEEMVRLVGHGRSLTAEGRSGGLVRVLGTDGTLIAVYRIEDGVARPEVVLA